MTLTKKTSFIFLCILLGLALLKFFADGSLPEIFLPALTLLLTAVFIGKTDKILLLPIIVFGLFLLSDLPELLELIGDLIGRTGISFPYFVTVVTYFLTYFLFLTMFIACLRRLVAKRSPVGSVFVRIFALLLLAVLIVESVCFVLGIEIMYSTTEEIIVRSASYSFFDLGRGAQIDFVIKVVELFLFYLASFSLVPAIVRPKENTAEIEKALRKLQDLYDRDVISKEEYAIKKSELLNLD